MKMLLYNHRTDAVQPHVAEGFLFPLFSQQRLKTNTKNSFKGVSHYLLVFSVFSVKARTQMLACLKNLYWKWF